MKSPNPFCLNHFLAAFLSLGALSVTSCKENASGPPAETKIAEESEEADPYPQTRNGWIPSERPDKTPHQSRTNSVHPSAAESFFNELNWTKPEEEPFISIEISGTNMMRANLTPRSTSELPEFTVSWRKPGENVEVEGVVFPVYTTFTTDPITNI